MALRRSFAGLVLIGSVLAAGCYESRDAPLAGRRDAGEGTQLDGAVGEAGVVRDGSVARGDGGSLGCGEVIPAFVGPGCAPATRACAQACAEGDPGCVDRCIARDGQCVACVDITLARCANARACQPSWEAFACCAHEQAECATRSGLDLLICAAPCERELAAYDGCLGGVAGECLREVITRCGLGS